MPNNHFISLDEACVLNKKFRQKRETMLDAAYRNQEVLPKCETFDREAFDHLLDRPGCVAVRVYLGMDNSNKIRLVIVGVDEEGRDMLPEFDLDEVNDNKILEMGRRCPFDCPPTSPLNAD